MHPYFVKTGMTKDADEDKNQQLSEVPEFQLVEDEGVNIGQTASGPESKSVDPQDKFSSVTPQSVIGT